MLSDSSLQFLICPFLILRGLTVYQCVYFQGSVSFRLDVMISF